MAHTFLIALLSLACITCSVKTPPDEPETRLVEPRATVETPPAPVKPAALPAFNACTDRPAPAEILPHPSFRHRRSKVIAKLGRVAHSTQDVIVKPNEPITIAGKFAYGRVSKDLEDELVALYVDDCKNWVPHGAELTDDDGRSKHVLPDGASEVGVFGVTQVMSPDQTRIYSQLTVVPSGTRLIVLDIDGTLTIGDSELKYELADEYFAEILSGKRHPKAYPGAAALTQAWAEKGYQIVYLTGRPYWLAQLTRQWLQTQGCASGHLHTTDRNRDALPIQAGVGEFKAAYLKELIEAGYVIDYVYGNTKSDVFAYASAGLSPAKTHIIGEHRGHGGTQALEGSYDEHLQWVSAQPSAVQPFTRK